MVEWRDMCVGRIVRRAVFKIAIAAATFTVSAVAYAQGGNLERLNRPLRLLQPLDDATAALQPQPGIQIFFDYFNLSWPWLLGTAAGFAVLQALCGGIQMTMSGGDATKRGAGRERLLWAIAGLLMIVFAGMILRTLNPLFYR